jgi:hypothetical protein
VSNCRFFPQYVFSQGLSVALACRLFADKVLSLGKAACMAKLPTESFIECLGQMGISAVNYTAISLAIELSEPIFMGERLGRQVAAAHGLAVIGSAGILIAAKRKGLIAEVQPVFLT